MKRVWIIVMGLISIILVGCQANHQAEISGSALGVTNIAQTEEEREEDCLKLFSEDSLSQDVYNALQHEWDSWNLMRQEEKMLSSHIPGYCQRSFDDWAECETFIGFSIPNPLEECSWLEKATYVAMPIGFRDAPRVKASWYGTETGHVEWVSICAGYRDGQIRVMIDATLYGDPADEKPSDSGWSVELARQNYPANVDDATLQITSSSTENYFSNEAYLAYDNVLYCLNVVGEPDAQTQVESALEQILDSFPR